MHTAPLSPNPTLAERFAWLIQEMFRTGAAELYRHRRTVIASLSLAMMFWTQRLRQRFEALHASWKAGTLAAMVRSRTSPRPSPQSGEGANGASGADSVAASPPVREGEYLHDAARLRPSRFLPRTFGWLRRIHPETAPWAAGNMLNFLEEPEMRAFFDAAPAQVGRVLRPYCRMVGATLPEWLRLPKRKRVRKAYPSPRPPGSSPGASLPTRGEGEEIIPNRRLPPKEQAEDARRRSDASGKPIACEKFTPEAFGWLVHPPRDGNCPPPKIGYGGGRRLPKGYKPPPRDDE